MFDKPYLNRACEEIDASVFSGDILLSESNRHELREYAERWIRAIEEQERIVTEADNSMPVG